MATKGTELLLLVISLSKELFAYALPAELSEPLELLWQGLIGGSSWMGYALVAIYYATMDLDEDGATAMEVCEVFGYLWVAIKEMAVMVDFAKTTTEGETTEEECDEACQAGKEAAARAALEASGNGGDASVEGEAEVTPEENADANAEVDASA